METINTLFPVVNFVQCVVTEVVLLSIVPFKTFDISQCSVQRHTWGVVGSLMTVLLQIFSWFWQWNNVENLLIFGKVKPYKMVCQFLGHPVYVPAMLAKQCIVLVAWLYVCICAKIKKNSDPILLQFHTVMYLFASLFSFPSGGLLGSRFMAFLFCL